MNIITKMLLSLVLLGIIDILIPLPLVGGLLIYVVLEKPKWFLKLVNTIYATNR